jgi:hypothetical protein
MVIEDLVQKYGIGYEEAMDKFYHSKVCALISDESTGVFTFAPREIVALFDEIDDALTAQY